MIKAIMAVDDIGGISKGSSMPWPKNSNDLQWFKKNTLNQVVVMGSKTWEDPFMPTPLKNRENILITTKDNSYYPGANRYLKGEFPNGDLYLKWRSINKKMISEVKGKVIWSLKVEAPHLINGNLEPIEEILAYWYPSHKAFLEMINSQHRKDNFELRKKLVSYAVIHRCDGRNVPQIK